MTKVNDANGSKSILLSMLKAEVTTEGYVADSSVTKQLLDQVHGSMRIVMADGGYDRAQSRDVIRNKKLKALIPPPKNARHRGRNDDRDRAVSEKRIGRR